MQPLTSPQDYIQFALRQKWWIIIPFVLIMTASVGVYKRLPKIYRATTLILVQPQEIPRRYVEPTVTLSVSDRLATISQQILSRTSLVRVIRDLNLVKDLSDPLLMSQKIGSMRKAIEIDVHRGGGRSTSSFSISMEDKNPVEAARIVNKIASLFISENLKVREAQARGTSQFLGKELLSVEKRLKQKEETIRNFKEKYMGELPSQLDANLRILERLQQQFETNNESIIAALRRKTDLENQIDHISKTGSYVLSEKGAILQDPLIAQLNKERARLQELETQYTQNHPDVIAAKLSIKKLEAQKRKRRDKASNEPRESAPINDPTINRLNAELQQLIYQIGRLRREQDTLKDQSDLYQLRVESAPKREEQMSALLRDYNLLQENYRSLLDKKIQAQLAENLERGQKAEQFKILDPASPPLSPVKPDKRKIFGLAFVLGVGFGGGLAFLREQMDRSFHTVDDVEQFLEFPVIASIPRIESKKSEKRAA
ncbi:MAG: XrtA system polysaccharide chain length determinant [Candidatus Hodarchaeota archaeon]